MADVFTARQRSRVMAAVRSRGNRSTELLLIALFRTQKIHGWRRNVRLVGRPDFVFPQSRVAVFVDGCFWHGCPVHYAQPASHGVYWAAKIARNRKRDREVSVLLREQNWTVVRLWEHELGKRHVARTLRKLNRALAKRPPNPPSETGADTEA